MGVPVVRLGLICVFASLAFVLWAPSAGAATLTAACSNKKGDAASLVTAISGANSAGGGTVVLGRGCTYTLSTVNNYWYGPNGLPAISSKVTIEGNGATITRSQAPGTLPFRLFFVGADPTDPDTMGYVSPGAGALTLRNVTLSGGLAKGGDSNSGGGGAGMGGAIFSQGRVFVDHSTITLNRAQGGASGNDGSYGGGGMGQNSTFSGGGFGGTVPGAIPTGGDGGPMGGGGGGGAGFATGENGLPGAPSGPGPGGGYHTGLGGDGCNGLAGGDGSGSGGAATGSPSTGTAGAGGDFGSGSVYQSSGGVEPGGGGGGVGGGGSTGEQAGGGGFGGGGGNGYCGGAGGFGGGGGAGYGVPNMGSTGGPGGFGGDAATYQYGGGGAGMGGAVFNMQGRVVMNDSTVYGNTAAGGADKTNNGSGIAGAVVNLNGTLTAAGSTFYDNAGTGLAYATQILNLEYEAHQARVAQTTLRDTIVFGGVGGYPDLASNKSSGVTPPSGAAAIADVSQFDLVGTKSAQDQGVITGSPLSASPMLGALQYNGGPTETLAPAAGSPVIDAGDATCLDLSGSPLITDQRGVPRPQRRRCDIGAYEVASPFVDTGPASAVNTATATLTGMVTANSADATVHFDYGRTAGYGRQTGVQHVTGVTPSRVSATVTGLSPNTIYHYRVVAASSDGTTFGAGQTFTTTATGGAPGTGVTPGSHVAPVVGGLKLSPTVFAAARNGASAAAAARRVGTNVAFTLNEGASVRFTVVQTLPGRRGAGGRCVKPSRKNHRARSCTRAVQLRGRFIRAGNAGANRFRFTGRLRGHKLRPGSYRLVAVPGAFGKTGRPVAASFRIVK